MIKDKNPRKQPYQQVKLKHNTFDLTSSSRVLKYKIYHTKNYTIPATVYIKLPV